MPRALGGAASIGGVRGAPIGGPQYWAAGGGVCCWGSAGRGCARASVRSNVLDHNFTGLFLSKKKPRTGEGAGCLSCWSLEFGACFCVVGVEVVLEKPLTFEPFALCRVVAVCVEQFPGVLTVAGFYLILIRFVNDDSHLLPPSRR